MPISQKLAALQNIAEPLGPAVPIPFGAWAPDLPVLGNPGMTVAENVIPAPNSYRPFKNTAASANPASQSDALNGVVLGAIGVKDTSGNGYHYSGTSDKLYEIRNNASTDKSGVAYSTAATDVWEFAQYKNNVCATNYGDPVQFLAAGGGGNFADLFSSTNKPKARHIATVRQFLVLGNTNDTTDGVKPSRVWWSAIGDETDMDPDSATQSDFEDLASGGQVQRVIGGADYGVIFQETQIRRMTYTADNAIFSFDPIDRQRGTTIPGSVVGLGRHIFYKSDEGFFRFNGTQSIPIGVNRFDKWFDDQFDIGNAPRVSSAIDFENKLVVWAFPGDRSTGGNPNTLLIYNWDIDRASYATVDVDLLVSTLTESWTLEQVDDFDNNIDTLSLSLDDPFWRGGDLRFGCYTNDHRLTYFTGPTLAAVLETGEVQIHRGRRSYVDFMRPLVDGGTVTCAVGGRDLQTDTNSYDSDVSVTSDGVAPVDNEARYHRFKTSIAASATAETPEWTHAQGIEVTGNAVGEW